MRGTVKDYVLNTNYNRITPAHAGNSLYIPHLSPYIQDHPRSCGEQYKSGTIFMLFKGSPPLMRGTARVT